jgi:hypothetical protein
MDNVKKLKEQCGMRYHVTSHSSEREANDNDNGNGSRHSVNEATLRIREEKKRCRNDIQITVETTVRRLHLA